MLYYCAYTWNQGTTEEQVDRRLVEQLDGKTFGVTFRGYYGLVGGAAGFLILESDDPNAIEELLLPFSDLMHWDVRAIVERSLERDIAAAKEAAGRTS